MGPRESAARSLHGSVLPERGYVSPNIHVDMCACLWASMQPMASWGCGGDHSVGNLKSGLRVRSAGLDSCPATSS